MYVELSKMKEKETLHKRAEQLCIDFYMAGNEIMLVACKADFKAFCCGSVAGKQFLLKNIQICRDFWEYCFKDKVVDKVEFSGSSAEKGGNAAKTEVKATSPSNGTISPTDIQEVSKTTGQKTVSMNKSFLKDYKGYTSKLNKARQHVIKRLEKSKTKKIHHNINKKGQKDGDNLSKRPIDLSKEDQDTGDKVSDRPVDLSEKDQDIGLCDSESQNAKLDIYSDPKLNSKAIVSVPKLEHLMKPSPSKRHTITPIANEITSKAENLPQSTPVSSQPYPTALIGPRLPVFVFQNSGSKLQPVQAGSNTQIQFIFQSLQSDSNVANSHAESNLVQGQLSLQPLQTPSKGSVSNAECQLGLSESQYESTKPQLVNQLLQTEPKTGQSSEQHKGPKQSQIPIAKQPAKQPQSQTSFQLPVKLNLPTIQSKHLHTLVPIQPAKQPRIQTEPQPVKKIKKKLQKNQSKQPPRPIQPAKMSQPQRKTQPSEGDLQLEKQSQPQRNAQPSQGDLQLLLRKINPSQAEVAVHPKIPTLIPLNPRMPHSQLMIVPSKNYSKDSQQLMLIPLKGNTSQVQQLSKSPVNTSSETEIQKKAGHLELNKNVSQTFTGDFIDSSDSDTGHPALKEAIHKGTSQASQLSVFYPFVSEGKQYLAKFLGNQAPNLGSESLKRKLFERENVIDLKKNKKKKTETADQQDDATNEFEASQPPESDSDPESSDSADHMNEEIENGNEEIENEAPTDMESQSPGGHKDHLYSATLDGDVLPFKCQFCKFGAKYLRTMARHMRKHEYRRHCFKCNKFLHMNKFDEHMCLSKINPDLQTFSCYICGRIVPMSQNLLAHYRASHPTEMETETLGSFMFDCIRQQNLFRCKTCGKTLNSESDMLGHVKLIHNNEETFVYKKEEDNYHCVLCQEKSEEYPKAVEHRRKKHSFLTCACPVCLSHFCDIRFLKTHIKQLHASHEKDWICCLCEEVFADEDNLCDHYLTHKVNMKYQCGLCRNVIKSIHSLEDLKHHIEIVHQGNVFPGRSSTSIGLTSFVCPKDNCESFFSEDMGLIGHIISHQIMEKYKFSCSICPFKTTSELLLQNHQKAFHYDKDIRCFVCSKRVASPDLLTLHALKHKRREEKKLFMCETCGIMLPEKEKYHNHKRSHMIKVKRPLYKCTHCEAKYRKKSSFARHLANFHPEEEKTFECEMLSCPHCDFTTTYRFYFRRHMDCHMRERPYNCDVCGTDFSSMQEVNKHKKKTHTAHEKPYRCYLCHTDREGWAIRKHITTPVHKQNCELAGFKPAEYNQDFLTLLGPITMPDGEKKTVNPKVTRQKCFDIHKTHIEKAAGKLDVHSSLVLNPTGKPTDTNLSVKHVCDVCDVQFKSLDELKQHQRILNVFKSTVRKVYDCQVCGFLLKSLNKLVKHTQTKMHIDNCLEKNIDPEDIFRFYNIDKTSVKIDNTNVKMKERHHFGILCKVCKIYLTTAQDIDAHVKKSEHIKNCQNQGVEAEGDHFENLNENKNLSKEEAKKIASKKSDEPNGEKVCIRRDKKGQGNIQYTFHCTVCSVFLFNKVQAIEHLSKPNHVSKCHQMGKKSTPKTLLLAFSKTPPVHLLKSVAEILDVHPDAEFLEKRAISDSDQVAQRTYADFLKEGRSEPEQETDRMYAEFLKENTNEPEQVTDRTYAEFLQEDTNEPEQVTEKTYVEFLQEDTSEPEQVTERTYAEFLQEDTSEPEQVTERTYAEFSKEDTVCSDQATDAPLQQNDQSDSVSFKDEQLMNECGEINSDNTLQDSVVHVSQDSIKKTGPSTNCVIVMPVSMKAVDESPLFKSQSVKTDQVNKTDEVNESTICIENYIKEEDQQPEMENEVQASISNIRESADVKVQYEEESDILIDNSVDNDIIIEYVMDA